MQEIDESVKNSLRRLIGQCGSVLAASRVLGVSHSTVLFWLNGKIRHISTDVWRERVYPVLSGKCTIPADLSELRLAERCRRRLTVVVGYHHRKYLFLCPAEIPPECDSGCTGRSAVLCREAGSHPETLRHGWRCSGVFYGEYLSAERSLCSASFSG